MSYVLFSCYGDREASKAAKILADEGITVIITGDGTEAMNVIAEKNEVPLVIFAHLVMPEMDGSELTATFRQEYPTAKTKILLETVKSSGCGPVRYWNANVEGYIMRPYSADQLVLSVEQLLFRNVTAL
ncbi:MAG: response regulator [Akkermansiaceae bacterium]|nr:response regulator [Armatimonadota bacterium]